MSLFPDVKSQRLRLLAELRAMEAAEQGLTAAEIVPTPEEKPSVGKVLFFLAGVGALIGWAVYGKSVFSSSEETEQGSSSSKAEKDPAKELISKIKLFKMNEEEALEKAPTKSLKERNP